jgi:hypothetical protein
LSKIVHISGHNASVNKFKKTEITPCILSDHNATKVELNNKRTTKKYSWRLNNTLLNDQEIREEIKKFLEFNENENITYQNLWNTERQT